MSESEIRPIAIVDELRQSYLDYAMSVIVSRALPDVRDGLKPVHRRALFAMHELGNDYNKPYKKSARVVGDVIGKYHPHGDTAVYDTIVRMAQDFSLRYLLVDGQGNFGSVDGDSPAAMRYTEVRMTRLAHDLLADLDRDTVDWEPNYDGSEQIPSVLPTRIPNLLINGAAGIAVGMATNMAPHNLTEVIQACLAYVDDPQISIEGLMQHISGPDFPTGGIIYGRAGIADAYRTGKGRLHIRSRYHIEEDDKTGRQSLIFTEIPYQANKARVIERIAELVKDKKIEGISELRDESDKDGMRIVVDLKRGENADVLVNNLFLHTPLQSAYSINMVALDNGQPRLMNLKGLIAAFIRHRQEVVVRRTQYELRKARERGHLLEGLAVALANIDGIIEAIRTSDSPGQARERLLAGHWQSGGVTALLDKAGQQAIGGLDEQPEDGGTYGISGKHYRLSPAQVTAILELRLHRLTGLEQDKLLGEYGDILAQITDLQDILNQFDRMMAVIRQELLEVLDSYGDARRTEIIDATADFSRADLIPEQPMVLTLSHAGYAKTQPVADYQAQRRGGRGKSATSMKEDDYIEHLVVTSSHSTVLCFTSLGRVYWIKVYDVPIASRGAKGRPLVNLLPLQDSEKVTAILPLQDYPEAHYVFMATAEGTVKRVALEQFSRPRSVGLIAIDLSEQDRLIGVAITDGRQQIMLFTSSGKAIRFNEEEVRVVGRSAMGVRGMRLGEESDNRIVSLVVAPENGEVLTACARGYGKRTTVDAFPLRHRGGQGVIAVQTSERNGKLVNAVAVQDEDDLMLITDGGTLVRTRVGEVRSTGRNAQGVMLMRLQDDEQLVSVVCLSGITDADEADADNADGEQAAGETAEGTMEETTQADDVVAAPATEPQAAG